MKTKTYLIIFKKKYRGYSNWYYVAYLISFKKNKICKLFFVKYEWLTNRYGHKELFKRYQNFNELITLNRLSRIYSEIDKAITNEKIELNIEIKFDFILEIEETIKEYIYESMEREGVV